jgi:hypothetical protein
MQLNSGLASGNDSATNKMMPKTVSPGKERMMLQVPMLATSDSTKQQTLPPSKRPRYEGNAMGLTGHGPLHWAYAKEPAQGVVWGGPGAQLNPHSDLPNARAFGMRTAVAMNGANPYAAQNGSYNIDPRMQLLRVQASDSMTMARQQQHFQYNPPQVRSGRGALRGLASVTQQNRAAMSTSPATTPSFRHGFPVSNRGKGSRKAATIRTPLPSSSDTKHETKNLPATTSSDAAPGAAKKLQAMVGGVSLSEAQRIGSSVKGGVAVAISRKTKRKLPMAGARKAAEASKAASAVESPSTRPSITATDSSNAAEKTASQQ